MTVQSYKTALYLFLSREIAGSSLQHRLEDRWGRRAPRAGRLSEAGLEAAGARHSDSPATSHPNCGRAT